MELLPIGHLLLLVPSTDPTTRTEQCCSPHIRYSTHNRVMLYRLTIHHFIKKTLNENTFNENEVEALLGIC